jgi:hypothetical protein
MASSFTKSFMSKKRIEVPGTDIFENVIQTRHLITTTYLEDMSVFPRPPPRKIKGLTKLKTPWDYTRSVFKDYVPDNLSILDKCFEYDWNAGKISKLIKSEEELELTKAYLRKIYKKM